MNFFTKKGIVQKILISIVLVLLLFNFVYPNYVQADSIGGTLFSPIKGFFLAVGDVCVFIIQFCFTGQWTWPAAGNAVPNNQGRWQTGWFSNNVDWPTIKLSPEEIFKGKVRALDINFIEKIDKLDTAGGEIGTTSQVKGLQDLRDVIAGWYMALRNLAIVALLSILVYVGIRIILSSASSEKAKYKQMLKDWVVALCLVFFLHYIMLTTLTITETITGFLDSNGNSDKISTMVDNGVQDTFKMNGNDITEVNNLMEYARLYSSLQDVGAAFGYMIIYLALVVYTVMFIITYMKRVIYMVFLTLIAPLVAMTYPLDKIKDGQAQAFNMWLKEYIFNALLQPFHLLIYTVLVGSAVQLASDNLVYALVALGFIKGAEKLLRDMFGFNAAKTAGGGAGAFAGGALASQAMNSLRKLGKGGRRRLWREERWFWRKLRR